MTGFELDTKLREYATEVTRSNILSYARKVVDLGFPAGFAFQYLSDIVLAKEQHEVEPETSRKPTPRKVR